MPIRHATPDDLPALLDLFAQARRFMAATGNPTQWAGGYPSADLLRADIAAGCSYVLDEDGAVLASFYYAPGPDPTYARIDGAWRSDAPYHVVHRIASASHGKGAAARCMAWCAARSPHLRIDTHHDNKVMQRCLQKQGFVPCGTVYLSDGSPRIGFERL